ncbi:MAG: hypothetical protein KBA48_15190, partial [Niveispirillum sp.]|nr:hypothetical protein [Niveispirillum sp.]
MMHRNQQNMVVSGAAPQGDVDRRSLFQPEWAAIGPGHGLMQGGFIRGGVGPLDGETARIA